MAKDLGCCGNVFRVLFVIFNSIYIVLGLLGLAGSIYSIVVSETYSFVTGNDTVGGAAIAFVGSVALIAVSIVGILGAILRWRPLLLIYAIVWAVFILLGIIGAAISFYYSDNVSAAAEEQYRDGWMRAIQSYDTDDEATRFVNAFQIGGECCGLNNASDWVMWNLAVVQSNGNQVPESCRCTSGENCMTFNLDVNGTDYQQTAYNRGCYDATVAFYQLGSLISGVVGIIFVIIEGFAVIVAIGLICCITRAANSKEYV